MYRPSRLIALLIFVLGALPVIVSAQREKLPPDDLFIVEEKYPAAQRTSTGLRIQVLREGNGAKPRKGDTVTMLYKGMLLDGTVFDELLDREKPFTFRLGRDQVIDGWDYAVADMAVGEKILLIVPYELGYGSKGRAPSIPRRATLVFEMELLGFAPYAPPGSSKQP